MATWTDEQKKELIDKYLAAEPTPTNSMEIVKEIAGELNYSPNAVRMILTQTGTYIKKEGTKPSTSSNASNSDKAPRVSKEGAQQTLTAAITNAGADADAEIISKLTGKAAQYFTAVIAKIIENDQD